MRDSDTNTVAPWEMPEPQRSEMLQIMKQKDLWEIAQRALEVADEQKAKLKHLCSLIGCDYDAL